jgi:CRP-like cAMP-binding protein
MSVWETARLMGFKRCAAMSKVFQVLTYEAGETVIAEGERGLIFFIIVSGTCVVHKSGIGNVAFVSRGQSFGELALTEGKNVRTATIRTETRYFLGLQQEFS